MKTDTEEEESDSAILAGEKQERNLVRVLMVEDDAGYRTFVQHLLLKDKSMVFDFVGVSRLQQCSDYLKKEIADVILLDLSLPDSNGLSTIDKVVQMSLGTPLIVLTAKEDDTSGVLAVSMGAQDYLLKHKISNDALIRCIRYAIERKRAEESRLRMAAIRDFTATLAHDLKVPLIGANNVLNSMLKGEFGELSHEQMEALSTLSKSNNAQLNTIQKLLELYKYEADSQNLKFEFVDMRTVLEKCIAQFPDHNSRLTILLPETVPKVRGISEALSCMFFNLLDNAIRFSDNSPISIKIELSETRLAVQIHNFGPAIPEEMMAGMFERFWQGIPGKCYVAHTGIGLYLCHKIASLHRARLACTSSQKEGTTMTVRFPLG